MLFSISGPTSSGKSTLLEAMKNEGKNVVGVQYARTLSESKKYTIQEISSNPDTCLSFHSELVEMKRKKERHLITDSDKWFTERSFIDFFIFLSFYFQNKFDVPLKRDLETYNLSSEMTGYYGMLYEFYNRCVQLDNMYYTAHFYLKTIPNKEEDGVRIVSDDFIQEQEKFYAFQLRSEHRIVEIVNSSLQERLNELTEKLKFFEQPYK